MKAQHKKIIKDFENLVLVSRKEKIQADIKSILNRLLKQVGIENKKDIDIGFARGLGYAIAQMWRAREKQQAEYLFNESGLSYEDFVKAKVDEYDLKEIKEVNKYIK